MKITRLNGFVLLSAALVAMWVTASIRVDPEIYQPPTYKSENTTGLIPSCGGYFDMCRFIDVNTRETRIPEKFQRAHKFYQDRAAVKIDGKWGYIDPDGTMVISPQFSAADNFFNGHAQVVRDGQAGLIDLDGRIAVPFNYRTVIPFTATTAFIREGEVRQFKLDQLEKSTFMFGAHGKDYVGLYDFRKGWLTPRNMMIKLFDRNNPGLFWARTPDSERKWGLMRDDGSWKVKPIFDDVDNFIHGLAVVEIAGKKGAVNKAGDIVIKPAFVEMRGTSYGFTIATGEDRKVGLFDKKGELVDGRFFKDVGMPNSSNKYVAVQLKNGKWRRVTTNMRTVPDKGDIVARCESGITIRAFMDKVVIRDAKGRTIGKSQFFPSYYSQKDCDAPIKVVVEGGNGHISHDGKYTPPTVQPSQSSRRESAEGPRIYTSAERAESLSCEAGNRRITDGTNWGMESSDGQLLVPIRYEALSCFEGGIAWVPVKDKKLWCPIGIDGKFTKTQPCRQTYYPFLGFHASPEELDKDRFENSRLWNLAVLEFGAGEREQPPKVKHRGPYG